MKPPPVIPPSNAYFLPIIEQLRIHGGSLTIEEMTDPVARAMQLSDAQREVGHGASGRSEVDYRMAWARTHLKRAGLLENSQRGVWRLTPLGRTITSGEVTTLKRRFRQPGPHAHDPIVLDRRAEDGPQTGSTDTDWVDRLLSLLQGLHPAAFERLCQRILRESGFIKVEVTGRSGDGGIDGTGVLRVNLLSFHVLFQCKRYTGSVSAPAIRDFRGAMVGRTDKGLIMTTGAFTADARREAVRDGAPAIDLIDGLAMCELLKELRIGVQVDRVEQITIIEETFAAS